MEDDSDTDSFINEENEESHKAFFIFDNFPPVFFDAQEYYQPVSLYIFFTLFVVINDFTIIIINISSFSTIVILIYSLLACSEKEVFFFSKVTSNSQIIDLPAGSISNEPRPSGGFGLYLWERE